MVVSVMAPEWPRLDHWSSSALGMAKHACGLQLADCMRFDACIAMLPWALLLTHGRACEAG